MVVQLPNVSNFNKKFQDSQGLLPTGCDIGNGSVKLIVGNTHIRMLSYYQPIHSYLLDFPASGYVMYVDGDRQDLQKTRWVGGISAYELNPIAVLRTVDDVRGKINYALQLLLSALTELPYQPKIQLAVVASIHDAEVFGSDLIQSLAGTHVVRLGNNPLTHVEIKVLRVYEEGLAALIHHRGELSTEKQNVIYDLGHGTTAVSLLGTRGKLLSRRVFPTGVESLIDAIARDSEVRRHFNQEGDRHLIRLAIERRDFFYGTTQFSIESAYRNALKPWIMGNLAPITKFASPWMVNAGCSLAIGGGAMLPLVSQVLAGKSIVCAQDAVWSYARGLRRLSEMLLDRAGKSSASQRDSESDIA